MCLPTFAQFPVFASLLDPVHGGCLELGIASPGGTTWASERGTFAQRYVPRTNILTTSWTVDGCRIVVRDAMPWGESMLLREIDFASAERPARVLVRMRPTFPTPPSARLTVAKDGIDIEDSRCQARGRLVCKGAPDGRVSHVDPGQIVYEFPAGSDGLNLSIRYEDRTATDTQPAFRAESTVAACQKSDEQWQSQAIRLDLPDGELAEMFQRSLLALRLLTYEPTGAVLAAATASFPSQHSGYRNWDYRFCWVRDGCYAAQALDLAGYPGEARRLYEFLLDRESNGQWVSPLWAIQADYPTDEQVIKGLTGARGETPIRIGNGAARQEQHDSPGNVLSGIYIHSLITGQDNLAAQHWERLARAAEWCCEHWMEPEAGIWEKRDRQRIWVHGRALCWVALRDALALGRRLGKSVPAHWVSAMNQIREALLSSGWSDEQGAYVSACEPASSYDVSVLALLLHDLVPPEDQRIRQTVHALVHHLAYGPAFRREAGDPRTAFYLATFWMIRALMRVGEYDRAYEHLRAALASATELGLMAEYCDPLTGAPHGNIPQAFSHEELIKTVAEMLWRLDGNRFVLFPAIPTRWLIPGVRISVSNIPLGGKRAAIGLTVEQDMVDFTAIDTDQYEVTVPRRFLTGKWRIRVNGASRV